MTNFLCLHVKPIGRNKGFRAFICAKSCVQSDRDFDRLPDSHMPV